MAAPSVRRMTAAPALIPVQATFDELGQPLREVVGKVAIQSVPASFGAVLANLPDNADSTPPWWR